MAVTQGNVGAALPGMILRAWAFVKADGTLLRGFGVAAASNTSAGNYMLTLAAPLASTNVITRGITALGINGSQLQSGAVTANTVAYKIMNTNGTEMNGMHQVEVWE